MMPTTSTGYVSVPSFLVQIEVRSGIVSPIFQPYLAAISLLMIAPVRVCCIAVDLIGGYLYFWIYRKLRRRIDCKYRQAVLASW